MTTERPICGITSPGLGVEDYWVCVREPHDKAYQRKSTDARHQGTVTGTGADKSRGYPAQADRHYFRRRYPHRPIA